jgi:hypothetical protein
MALSAAVAAGDEGHERPGVSVGPSALGGAGGAPAATAAAPIQRLLGLLVGAGNAAGGYPRCGAAIASNGFVPNGREAPEDASSDTPVVASIAPLDDGNDTRARLGDQVVSGLWLQLSLGCGRELVGTATLS